ncbi:MAG: YegS/Rv2252/BmrU family lipid kinase [Lachnospiraceae bacterium]|nr:YegS/Rv2252/BmrU family lipid kinase [Lachnospiraceae bacterium]MBQ9234145.1 YegS/Rv2252/BmrU family lipid kinase [Lachnospiraceae bacterium]
MYYFIVNVSGGSGKAKKTWISVREELKKRNVLYKAFRTKSSEHAGELAGKISMLPDDNIHMVVVGGDGTINAVLNGIKNFERITFSVIPSGSANDFAGGLGISKDPVKALIGVLDDKKESKWIDIGRVTTSSESRLFGISSGIGLDAIVCKKALDSKIKNILNKLNLGSLTYIILTVISLFTMDYIETEIEAYDTDDKPVIKEKINKMIFAAFMNVKAEGGGVPMAPDAKYDDGRLSVCIASDISKLSAFTKLPLLVMAKQDRIKGFKLFDAKKLVIKIKEPAVLHADGEYVGDEETVNVECLENKLRIKM